MLCDLIEYAHTISKSYLRLDLQAGLAPVPPLSVVSGDCQLGSVFWFCSEIDACLARFIAICSICFSVAALGIVRLYDSFHGSFTHFPIHL